MGVVEGNVEEERPRDGEGGDGGGVAKGCPPPPKTFPGLCRGELGSVGGLPPNLGFWMWGDLETRCPFLFVTNWDKETRLQRGRFPSPLPCPLAACPRDARSVSPLILALQELPDKCFDSSDVSPNLQDRTVLLCVGEVEGVDSLGPNMLLPNYPCKNADRRCARRSGEQGVGCWLLLLSPSRDLTQIIHSSMGCAQQTLVRVEDAASFSSHFCRLQRHFHIWSKNGTHAGTTLSQVTGVGKC